MALGYFGLDYSRVEAEEVAIYGGEWVAVGQFGEF